MKFSLLILAIAVMLHCSSCHRSTGQENTSGSATEVNQNDEAGTITITREQFESMNMKVGDPLSTLFRDRVTANAYVEASPSGKARISTLISGRVRQINFSTGDYVTVGQVLFTLESPEFILLQQNYAEAFQRMKLLKADYERLKVLWEEKVAAQKDFIKAESDYMGGLAEVEGMRVQLNMLNVDPGEVEKGNIFPYLTVKSPIPGTITNQQLSLGKHLVPLEPAMEIVNMTELRLRLELFEKSIPDLQLGQEVEYFAPDKPEQIYIAILNQIGKSVSSETRTLECYAQMAREDKSAFVNNMFVESSIITCEREALAIPEQALLRDGDMEFILILMEDRGDLLTFQKVPIKTGVTRQGFTEILDEGLRSILLEGAYNLGSGE